MAAKKYAHLINLLHMKYGADEARMAPAYEGFISNPPLFFDETVYPNAKCWAEVLHAYAPGGSFGTPVLKGMASGHRHEFDECFLFFGSNPDKVGHLCGEVEFWLGEGDEAEKYMLTRSCAIYIPAGTTHSPCVYRKVDNPLQPIILVVVALPPKGVYVYGEDRPLPTDFVM
jgi:hypothetical protein